MPSFEVLLWMHLNHGYVHSTPEYFYMGRPVNKDEPYEKLIDPISRTNSKDWNSWCVYFMAGDMNLAFDNLPFYLPYCTFEHKGILKTYPLENLKHKISKYYGIWRKTTAATAAPVASSESNTSGRRGSDISNTASRPTGGP